MPANWTESTENRSMPRNNLHLKRGFSQEPHSGREAQFENPSSKPKSRTTVIKVNKAKFPSDFFPKSFSFEKKLPRFKTPLEAEKGTNPPYRKRIQSQRLHISPQKTSFFGFFENEGPSSQTRDIDSGRRGGSNKKRKFQTRDEPKRENMHLQMNRKYTPGSHSQRNDLIELFPNPTSTYEQIQTQIILNNSSVRNSKISPRKEHQSRLQQIQDPEKQRSHQQRQSDRKNILNTETYKYETGVSTSPKKAIYLSNLEQVVRNREPTEGKQKEAHLDLTFSSKLDMHNVTFFNAKSSCLPPIRK